MGWESLVAIKVFETARPMRHSACGHPSGPAAVTPHQQAGHTTASNDSRRNDQFPLASWGPSTHDRNDARGIAQLIRMGWFRPVHCKSPPAQEIRALLVGRKLLQAKLLDVELSIRGILRGFGLKVGVVSKGRFAARIRELVTGQAMLERVIEPMLRAREALRAEYHALHRAVLGIAREDTICRRLMTVPGVGVLVAITFTSAVDDPGRFARSRTVGAHFGLTPKKYQSGETDVTAGISKVGDAMVRSALYEAANVMLTRASRFSTLKRWALEVAGRRGMKRAKVALARKLATILHRMWVDELPFRQGGRRRSVIG
jgi:transposase